MDPVAETNGILLSFDIDPPTKFASLAVASASAGASTFDSYDRKENTLWRPIYIRYVTFGFLRNLDNTSRHPLL